MENVPEQLLMLAGTKGFNVKRHQTFVGVREYQDILLLLLQTWLREEKKLNLWIEHGSTKNGKVTHDITTDKGCLRGGYSTYNEALMKGIEILLNELN